MKLYHGTNEKIAGAVLETGILPRNVSNATGNWNHTTPSRSDMVYLTETYAPYFACCASGKGSRWAILEVDTGALWKGGLFPDEDFLEQVTRNTRFTQQNIIWGIPGDDEFWQELAQATSIDARTTFFRENLIAFQGLWEKSLDGLGNCAFWGPIAPNAISRVAFFDPKQNPTIALMALDPSISIINHSLCKKPLSGTHSVVF